MWRFDGGGVRAREGSSEFPPDIRVVKFEGEACGTVSWKSSARRRVEKVRFASSAVNIVSNLRRLVKGGRKSISYIPF